MASKLLCCLDADQGARERGKADENFKMRLLFQNFGVGQMKTKRSHSNLAFGFAIDQATHPHNQIRE
jgi:hypothetical protein